MRRRLQGTKPTDCACRTIFGGWNRYASAAPAETGTSALGSFLSLSHWQIEKDYRHTHWSARRKSALDIRILGHDRTFLFLHTNTFASSSCIDVGTPAVKNNTHHNLRLRLRRDVSFSDKNTPVRPKPSNDIPTENQPRPNLYKEQQRSVGALYSSDGIVSTSFFIRTASTLGDRPARSVGSSCLFISR